MYNINSTRSIQYISKDIKKRIGKEIDKSKIMTMSCSCSNFNNVKRKLTCVAWNCSRKTTLTFVFSSFHFEILDITGKLIDHRLHISEFLLIILLPFILNQPTNKWNDNNTLNAKNICKRWKFLSAGWQIQIFLQQFFCSHVSLWIYFNKCIEKEDFSIVQGNHNFYKGTNASN